MNTVEIQLPFASRYKKTELYTKNGRTFFGVWKAPKIQIDGNERMVVVSQAMTGNLNLLAFQEYGDADLFWAIALVNNIKNPPEEVVTGLQLVLPKYEHILAALTDSSEML